MCKFYKLLSIGPFNAELMQKWFDDGYFTGDLPMKRTYLDTQWFTVDELVKQHGGSKIFVTPPVPVVPPGLPVHRDIQNIGQDPLPFNGPYQPAPIRNLRSTTLDSCFGSNASDSPSSSFGGGRFGNGSPDPNAFGGRGFFSDNALNPRTQAFGAMPDPSNVFNRRNFNGPPLDPSSARNPAFGNVAPNRGAVTDGFGYNRTYSPSHGWNTDPFDPNRTSVDSFSSPFGLAPTNTFGTPQDVYAEGSSFPNGNYNPHVNGLPQSQYAPSPVNQIQQTSSTSFVTTPQTVSSDFDSSPVPPQSPWNHEAPVARRPGPFDSAHPTSVNTVVLPSATGTSPWGQASSGQPSRPSSQVNESSPWQPPSDEGDDWKTPIAPDSLTFSNIVQHNQQQQLASTTESNVLKPEIPEEVPTNPIANAEQVSEPKTVASTKTKTRVPSVQLTPAKSIPQIAQEPNTLSSKAPWSKEDEGKSKPSGVSVSLRDIQEAEAKKTEAKKAAEREKERTARAVQLVTGSKDAAQPFTASWGLPTSQVGSRAIAVPVKETNTTVSTTVNPPVWTNTSNVLTAKKTMKEIQEEEERRKKNAIKDTISSAVKRAYADTTQKVTSCFLPFLSLGLIP